MEILVGYDGSDGGRDALELTRVLAEATDATVLVVTVLPYGPLPIPYELLAEEEVERAGPLFEEARERLGELEIETRAFGGGTPAGVINDLAEREKADTIVVGSPHRGAVGRTLLGSVADGLLHGAPASFAGMNETLLNVHGGESLLAAMHACWASLFGARTIYYRAYEKMREGHLDGRAMMCPNG